MNIKNVENTPSPLQEQCFRALLNICIKRSLWGSVMDKHNVKQFLSFYYEFIKKSNPDIIKTYFFIDVYTTRPESFRIQLDHLLDFEADVPIMEMVYRVKNTNKTWD